MPSSTRPTLQELIESLEKSLASKIKTTEQPLAVQKANARAWGYAFNALHDRIDYMGLQMIGLTSEGVYLRRHCAEIGLFPKTKTFAYGTVSVPGEVGTELAAGVTLTRDVDGIEYRVLKNTVFESNPQTVEVECLTAGTTGNAAPGVKLSFNTVLEGLEGTATVILIGAGADDETDDDLLARYLTVIRNKYLGGADSDWIKWALEVEGVNRAWVSPCGAGAGTVIVRIMTPTGFPDEILLQKVYDYIASKRPVTVKRFFVISPTAKAIDITISGLQPNTSEMKNSISEALTRTFNLNAEPGGMVLVMKINSGILSVIGLENYHLDSPTADIQLDVGEIATLGTITWN